MYLSAGTRVIVKSSVVGWAVQGTWVDRAKDGFEEVHVVRLDTPVHGFNYLALRRHEFLY
jgi:hypothetical protein